MRELLVTKIPFADALERHIRDQVLVVQEMLPHVIVIEGDQASVSQVTNMPEVLSGPAIGDYKVNLSRSERLFLDAWNAGPDTKVERVHDGMSWGAFGKGP